MTPRTLTFILLATLVGFGAPVSAKEKKAPAARTWKNVVDYVLANGADRKIKLPGSKLLGYDSEEVPTKALRYKSDDSPDGKGHAIYVISALDKDGKSSPKDMVLGNRIAVTKDGVKSINDFIVRTDLNGKIISAATLKGPATSPIETILPVDSAEVIAGFRGEQTIHLKTMDFNKFSSK